MRLIKLFVAGFTGLFIFATLLSLLIPSHPSVSRTLLINADKQLVYAEVNDLANWPHWHPFFTEAGARADFGKLSKGVGASADIAVKQKSVHLQITGSDSNSVKFEVSSPGENTISNEVRIATVPGSSQQQVDWIATTHLHWYPWEKFYAIFIDKLTGPGYEAALNGLRNYSEKR